MTIWCVLEVARSRKQNDDTEYFVDHYLNTLIDGRVVASPTYSLLVWHLHHDEERPSAFIEQGAREAPRVRHHIGGVVAIILFWKV